MGVVKYFQDFMKRQSIICPLQLNIKKIILTTISGERYHMEKNDNLRAIIDYRKSLSLNANNASCIHNYAKALGREGEWQSAFKQVERP